MIATTPQPPYYAVIFTAIKTTELEGYSEMAEQMHNLAQKQEGFLGMESAQENLEITVSYWTDLQAIANWKNNADHQIAQQKGKENWYKQYKTRITKVERDYEFDSIKNN